MAIRNARVVDVNINSLTYMGLPEIIMRPSQKLLKLVRIMRICATLCGADVVDKNYKVNASTYFLIFLIVIYFVCLTYTLAVKIQNDVVFILESLCISGFVIQGVSKLVSTLSYERTYRSQYELLISIYEQYEAKGKEYCVVLDRCISRIQVAYKTSAFLYTVGMIMEISIPLLFWALTGRHVLLFQFIVPFLSVDTLFGYLCTVALHVFCLIFAAAGNFTLDMFILMFFAHSAMFVDIFRLKAEELNEMASDCDNQETRDQLKDIIEWHQTYSNFVEDSDKIFFWVNFTQVTTSGVSIVLTLLVIIIGDWPGSYALIIFSFYMLYLYCGMGTLVELANDRLTEEIYAIHWYLLTIPQQKTIQFMLMKSQSPKQITVGGIAPLSVSTGLQVTKTIYSFFMMMLNFFD